MAFGRRAHELPAGDERDAIGRWSAVDDFCDERDRRAVARLEGEPVGHAFPERARCGDGEAAESEIVQMERDVRAPNCDAHLPGRRKACRAASERGQHGIDARRSSLH